MQRKWRWPLAQPEKIKLMIHDDSCDEKLDHTGNCPKCGFHPDMQSTAFMAFDKAEIDKLVAQGRTFLGPYRTEIR